MGKHLGEQRRRQDILAAARSLFVRKGYADTSLDDIAKAAGISRGGMYFYYRNKVEMLAALSKEQTEESLAFLVQALQGPMMNPQLLLESIVAYYIRFLVTQQEASALYQLLMDTALRDEEIRAMLAENLVQVENTLTTILERSGVMEGMEADISAKDLAMLINTVVEGVKSRYLVTKDPEAVRQIVQALTSMTFPLSPALSQRSDHGNQQKDHHGGAHRRGQEGQLKSRASG